MKSKLPNRRESTELARFKKLWRSCSNVARDHQVPAGEELRGALLQRMKARALTRGDRKLGLNVIAQEVKVEALKIAQEKLKESMRTKIQAGLDAILDEAGTNAVVKAAVEQIRKATAKE
jgi:hypothetical protein